MASVNYAIGVDLGGTTVKVGIASDKGKIVKTLALDTNAHEGPKAVISQIKKAVKKILKDNKRTITGIGIGAPGAVILKKGTVENPPNFPGWEKVPLGAIIKKSFNLPTYVENDANAAAIGEMIFGAGKKLNSFLMVTLGTGVGGGLIIDRRLYRGETGAAGELGHISIDYKGDKCNCGSSGCIETFVGNNYMIKRVKNALENRQDSILTKWHFEEEMPLTPKLIYEAACENDVFANEIISDIGYKLGAALGSAINLLDVSNVIIGGGVAGFGDRLFDSVTSSIKEHVLTPIRPRVIVKAAKLKNEAGIKGASALVFYKS